MNREELVELILQGKKFLTRDECEVLGISYPPKSGWRKKIRKGESLGRVKTRDPLPTNQNGYIHRATGTGRSHLWVYGQTLCRIKMRDSKYVFTPEKPNIPLCSICDGMSEKDPKNNRVKPGQTFYQTWEWKKARFETIKRYGPVCMCCGSEYRIVVDHIKPLRKYPHLSLDPENLQVLCDDCNRGKSWDDETDFRPKRLGGAVVDEFDEIQILLDAKDRLN